MENFATVLAICRTALRYENKTLTRSVGQLRDQLRRQGDESQANALAALLDHSVQGASMVPTKVVLSSTSLVEKMTKSIHAPVDRETGAPLASISLPETAHEKEQPILEDQLQAAITSLIEEWKHSAALSAAGVRPPLSLLMYGEPGTGKTVLAQAIAEEMKMPLVTARLDGLISSFLGTTARNIATLFEFANRYDCILLLDEFDAVAKVRDDPHEIGEIKRVVNTLLQCLDGRRDLGFTIAITNHEHLLDAAIWRRFDTTIAIPKPSVVSRRKIVERFLRGLEVDPVDIDFLAWLTEGRSGAQIEAICDSIKRHLIMSGEGRQTIMAALRVNTLLNADTSDSERSRLIAGEPEPLARELATSESLKFTQESLAKLFNTTQPTISRWIRK